MMQYERKWLEKLDKIIDEYISDHDFQLPDLANAINVSIAQLNRKVNKLTGQSPRVYIRSKKLAKAKELLEIGAYPTVAETSAAVGYKQPIYFSHIFYEAYGKRPIEYLQSKNNSK